MNTIGSVQLNFNTCISSMKILHILFQVFFTIRKKKEFKKQKKSWKRVVKWLKDSGMEFVIRLQKN